MPAYNPGAMLASTLERVRRWLERPGASREAILVDDGSTDGSSQALARVQIPAMVPPRRCPVGSRRKS